MLLAVEHGERSMGVGSVEEGTIQNTWQSRVLSHNVVPTTPSFRPTTTSLPMSISHFLSPGTLPHLLPDTAGLDGTPLIVCIPCVNI